MKKAILRFISLLLFSVMLAAAFPAAALAEDGVYTDYSVSPEYAARYPAGVIRFYQSEVTLDEGEEVTLKLIRTGGTQGEVSVELKAIDVSAKYGTDYTVSVKNKDLVLGGDYAGTLTELYLEQIGEDLITADEILTDEVYKGIIGYSEETGKKKELSDEDAALLHDASVALVSDTLGVTPEEAEDLVDAGKKAEDEGSDADGSYKSPLHELKDSVLNETTAPNSMVVGDIFDVEDFIGNNKDNLVASSVYAEAAGASLRVVFKDGENEKTIVIKALNDGAYEPQEAATLGICNPEGGAELGDIIGVSLVIDSADGYEESTLGFDVASVTVDSDEAAATIEIVRTGCLNDYAQITLKTVDGSAHEGEDYLPIDTTSVFYPGEERKAVLVPLKTSVYDQTKAKKLGLKLGLESGGAKLGTTEAVINILPKAATNAHLAKAGKTAADGWIVLPLDKIKCSGNEAVLLFSDVTNLDYTYLASLYIEVDITVKDSGDKYTRERWLNEVYNDQSFSGELNYYNNLHNTTKERNVYGISVYDSKDPENWRAVRTLFAGESTTLSATIGFNDTSIQEKEIYNKTPLDKYCLSIQETTFYFQTATEPPDSTTDIKKPDRIASWERWHDATWDNIQIDEVRIYPYKYDMKGDSSAKGEYRTFDGTGADSIIGTVTYDAGKFTVPNYIYRGFDFSSLEYTLNKKAVERYAKVYEYVLSVVGYKKPDQFGYSPKMTCGAVSKKPNEVFSLYDRETLLSSDESLNLSVVYYYYLTPVVRGDNIGFIKVEDYDKDKGALKIGGKTYRDTNVASSEWREGDELILNVEPLHGYKCTQILITRKNGNIEYIAPGEKVIMTKGMSVKPILCEEDITITVKWAYPGVGGYESMAENLKDYAVICDPGNLASFTDNGDGTYTFSNMTPGDVVTLFAVAKNQNDTCAIISSSYLETLAAGTHTLTLVTDAGSFDLTLNVLAADDKNYTQEKYRVTGGVPAVWKKGTGEKLTIAASSNAETVVSVKIDGVTLSGASYEAVKGFVKNKTGFWTRTTLEGETRLNDDLRFLSCVGDAYAFQVDDHNMIINYYFTEKDMNGGGALVTGRVVTNGGTIKRPNTVTVTAENVNDVGIPVSGAKIYVASDDVTASKKVDGVYYYTQAQTNADGYFTVYLPSYVVGLGYCISITSNDRVYQNVSVFQLNGTTVYQLPTQNLNYQIDRMTVGSDMDTSVIYVDDTRIKLGVHAVIGSGYVAQKLVFKSYDSEGTTIAEWTADLSPAEDWTYESEFVAESRLKEGGRLTVQIFDQYNRGQGEYDTGYTFRTAPKSKSVILPQFDPMQSVTLPFVGDVTTVIDFGSGSDVVPTDAQPASATDISSAGKTAAKHPFEITFGAAKQIKLAIKQVSKIPGYENMDVRTRTAYILAFIKDSGTTIPIWTEKDAEQSKPQDDNDVLFTPDDPSEEGPIVPIERDQDDHSSDNGDQDPPAQGEQQASARKLFRSGDTVGREFDFLGDDLGLNEGGGGGEESANKLDKDPTIKTDKDKDSLVFTYALSVYVSMYSQDGKFYVEGLTLYANLALAATVTRQFTLLGVPAYFKLNGYLGGEFLIHCEPKPGTQAVVTGINYLDEEQYDNLETAGDVKITIRIEIGTGVGNLKIVSFGISGSMDLVIEYQPWTEGAGIVTFSVDLEASLLAVKIKYSIYRVTLGMFRTDGYSGTLDFSNVWNKDKFPNARGKRLLSYTDENSMTEIFGSYEQRPRGASLNGGNYAMTSSGAQDPYERVLAEKKIEGVINTVSPILIPICGDEKILYLRLDDDSTRGNNDFSAVAYSIIDWDGNETEPVYLDQDSTFDFNLTAAPIGGGRTLVVWSDLDVSYGETDPESLGAALNRADLSYCIFDENGVPGEVKKLTNDYGYEGLPTIAYDEQTGKIFISYVSTDYQTEGVEFGEDNLDEIGNFLYNSYSTVCFKVLDGEGAIIKGYTPAEKNYEEYENTNGIGMLNGMRYLNTQLDNRKSQATIHEISSAAAGGKVYTVYSLDTDRATATDSDRDLYIVTCDLDTMEQSAPILLSDKETADTNPQLITYNGRVQLYWNDDGKINCGDVKSYLENDMTYDKSFEGVEGMEKISNAATSYAVSVQPGGKLCIVWIDWEEVEGKNVPAIYFREFDPDYGTYIDEDENERICGQWGAITKLAAVGEGHDITEFAYVGQGRRMMLSYIETNKDEEGKTASHDSVLTLLKGGNREELGMNVYPKYPLPGEQTTLSVTAKNTASLPSRKITVKTELVSDGEIVSEIGTQVFEGHFASDGKITAVFDEFVMPEDPDDYKVRVTAWDDDLDDYPAVEEFKLPHSYNVRFNDMKMDTYQKGVYGLSFTAENTGNKAFGGGVAVGYTTTEGTGEDEKSVFERLTWIYDLDLEIGERTEKQLLFMVPDKLYDEDGVCELELAVCSPEGYPLMQQPIYLYKPVTKLSVPTDVETNDNEGSLELTQGQTFALDGRITPYSARSGYHVTYSVGDSEIASVDEHGNVVANKAGKTTVTVSAVKNKTSLFISDGLRGTDGAGVPLQIDENGRLAQFGETEEDTVAFTKTVEITVTGSEPIGYSITEGDGAEWKKGADNGVTFRSDANKDDFNGVKVDGETVGAENYTVAEDGAVTLKASYLETLEAGEHAFAIVSSNGEANARFTVRDNPPDTGDSTYLYIMLTILSLCGTAAAVFFARKKRIASASRTEGA